MAQKQFKIGLSNTDKQNMAQDVYERVLALTFNEYDTTTEYEVGDFVVYNDQLYKCIGATSGAWDSTKWQLATLNDLVNDIENAVAFVNDKANVDGNYPTMTVGAADNLTPYDEDSGVDQEQPFLLQGTGCGNGEQQVDTGALGLLKEKQGNAVVVNQHIQNGDFSNGLTNWNAYSGTGSVSNNTLTVIGAVGRDGVNYIGDSKTIGGHKYLFSWEYTSTVDAEMQYALLTYSICPATNSFTKKFALYEPQQDETYGIRFDFFPSENGVSGDLQLKNCFCVDLTQWFGSNDNIPAHLLAHPEDFFRYYQGSLAYNEGTLVNSNGRYIKCIGMNQWDEEWEVGYIDTSNGENVSGSSTIRSKNYIKVIPNTSIYLRTAFTTIAYCPILFYDKDKNFISANTQQIWNRTIVVPANACFMRFYMASGYGTTYNNDISINLYYEDEPRCLTYEPYQVLTNNDTGNEELRSAGSVKDIKLPSGEITRRVGYVDLGELDWDTYSSPESHVFRISLSEIGAKPTKTNNVLGNAICPRYTLTEFGPISANDNMCFAVSSVSNNRIVFVNQSYSTAADFKTAMSGVYLFYELAEPTTEQGTPYSENIAIDDFGSMDFGGTNGVPQGASIFYAVDYKAFIDTLHKYTDGTVSNIALKSDLSADKTELQGVDTQLLNAVGGTLRQLLATSQSIDFDNTDFIDISEATWYHVGNSCFLIANAETTYDSNSATRISTKYKNNGSLNYQTEQDRLAAEDKHMYGWAYNIWIKDTRYTDATEFKNGNKGVLLAYKKASE